MLPPYALRAIGFKHATTCLRVHARTLRTFRRAHTSHHDHAHIAAAMQAGTYNHAAMCLQAPKSMLEYACNNLYAPYNVHRSKHTCTHVGTMVHACVPCTHRYKCINCQLSPCTSTHAHMVGSHMSKHGCACTNLYTSTVC